MNHEQHRPERRSHQRFPIMTDLAEPIELVLTGDSPQRLPAVLTDLSVGGMALIVFAHVHGDTRLRIVLNVPGLEGTELHGHVTWTEQKGDTTAVGVQFNHVSSEATRRITQMAEAFQDCELKSSFGLKDVCFPHCNYRPLCHKPVKTKH